MSQKVARAFLVVSILQRFSTGWFFSTYSLFLKEHGLNPFQLNTVNVVFMTVYFLLDPYTGSLADKYGQKRIHIWGMLFWSLGMLIYGISHSYPFFLLAESLAGIGSALMSGALAAWLNNQIGEQEANPVFARVERWATLAVIPSALLGGLIGEWAGKSWPWLLSALTCSLASLWAYALLHNLPEKGKSTVRPLVGEIMGIVWRHRSLRFAAVVNLSAFALFQPINMYWPLVFENAAGGQTWWFGSFWIGISLAIALGVWITQHKRFPVNGQGLGLALLIAGLPLASTFHSPSLAMLVAMFLVHEIARGMYKVSSYTYRNRHIGDETRTTANSVTSSAGTLGAAIGLLVSGSLTFIFPLLTIWSISALALIILGVYAWVRKE